MGAASPGAGGFNGGGSGGITDGGGGGGASDIRTSTSIGTRLVVAGGGGGASAPPSTVCVGGVAVLGGNGGGMWNIPIGSDAQSLPCSSSWSPYTTATGGSLLMGGSHGVDPWGVNSLIQGGSFGIGGSQMNLQSNKSSGGGGGGGYFGGGAGGFGPGGGGSSYCSSFVCSSTYFSVTNAGSAANGYVTVTFALPNSAPNIITTIAGLGGVAYFAGDGLTPSLAGFNVNSGITVDIFGNIYVADKNNQRIRKAVANIDGTMTMTTFAGIGTVGSTGDSGPATSAYFTNPSDVAVDASGSTVYITDNGGHRIRKVVVATGIITTYAGTGTPYYNGDGIAATSAQLWFPDGIVVASNGDLYIADVDNHIVRFVKFSTGIIIRYAGTASTPGSTGDFGAATSAKLSYPGGVTLDSSNNLYIADTRNNRIRIVNAITNIITTVAGENLSGGYGGDYQLGTATSTALNNPPRITHDPWLDCFYIADSNNNRIRVLTSNGMLYTVAGTGVSGFYGDNYAPLSAKLNGPVSMAVDANGNVFISDTVNSAIREIAYNPSVGLIQCPFGQYRCATTASGCCICPVGSYCPGADIAYTCPANTYNAVTGGTSMSACIACPSYMAAVAGSSVCTYAVNTIIGTGTAGSLGDRGPASLALLNAPKAVVMDKSGNLYVSDTGNNEIRKITNFAQHWGYQNVTRIAGISGGITGTDGIVGFSAALSAPWDIDVDLSGNVYIANYGNNNVKMISVVDGTISTVAGYTSGTGGYSGDNAAATNAGLNGPAGLFLTASGSIYISDKNNNRIRFVNRVTGIITTVAGNGVQGSAGDGSSALSANLFAPSGIFLDPYGTLYIADTNNNRIRMVINGIISTLAGNECPLFPSVNFSLFSPQLFFCITSGLCHYLSH